MACNSLSDFMHERDREGLVILMRAANQGLPCPSNEHFCAALGFKSSSAVVYMMDRLQRRGLIKVQRFQRSRVVEIVLSGKKTATPKNTTPHWQDKRKASDMLREKAI